MTFQPYNIDSDVATEIISAVDAETIKAAESDDISPTVPSPPVWDTPSAEIGEQLQSDVALPVDETSVAATEKDHFAFVPHSEALLGIDHIGALPTTPIEIDLDSIFSIPSFSYQPIVPHKQIPAVTRKD